MLAQRSAAKAPSGVARARGRTPCVRVACSDDTPANVLEARAWIDNWKAKQGGSAALKRAAAARSGGGGGGGKMSGTPQADGTLLFTADSLQAVPYTDVKLH